MALEISEKLVDGILVMEITGVLVVGDEAGERLAHAGLLSRPSSAPARPA